MGQVSWTICLFPPCELHTDQKSGFKTYHPGYRHVSVTPTFRRQRQEHQEFEASLGYKAVFGKKTRNNVAPRLGVQLSAEEAEHLPSMCEVLGGTLITKKIKLWD